MAKDKVVRALLVVLVLGVCVLIAEAAIGIRQVRSELHQLNSKVGKITGD